MRVGLKTHFSLIIVASSVAQARSLMSGPFVFHLIVCDYHLEDGDGMSVYHWLRKDLRLRVPFVLISGHFQPDSIDDPAFDFLAKPFRLRELLGVLSKFRIQTGA
jgi:DNA-binding NtrC family response regulator